MPFASSCSLVQTDCPGNLQNLKMYMEEVHVLKRYIEEKVA